MNVSQLGLIKFRLSWSSQTVEQHWMSENSCKSENALSVLKTITNLPLGSNNNRLDHRNIMAKKRTCNLQWQIMSARLEHDDCIRLTLELIVAWWMRTRTHAIVNVFIFFCVCRRTFFFFANHLPCLTLREISQASVCVLLRMCAILIIYANANIRSRTKTTQTLTNRRRRRRQRRTREKIE